MTKNIAVIDAQGNEYEATYPKRAKGLVKNGRARFVNETTICLACPPPYTEGTQMNTDDILKEAADTVGTADTPMADSQPDAAYIMQKIDQILSDTQYLTDAIASIAQDGVSGECQISIGNLAAAREKTNQALIGLLENMLERVMPAPSDPDTQKLAMLLEFMEHKNLNEEGAAADIANQIVQKLM